MTIDLKRTGAKRVVITGARATFSDHVMLWTGDTDLLQGRVNLGSLSLAERRWADRLPATRAAERWLTGQALLRQTLGACLDIPAGEVAFEEPPGGRSKPRLCAEQRRSDLNFNACRSGPYVAIAVAWCLELGVGCECFDPQFEWQSAARCALTAAERSRILARKSKPEMRQAFFEIWARKRAVLHALGSAEGVGPGDVHIAETADYRRWTSVSVDCGALQLAPRKGPPHRVAELRVASVDIPDLPPMAVAVVGDSQPAIEVHVLEDQIWAESVLPDRWEGAQLAM
jgi:phosphopantetheinyl transferase